MNEIEKIEKRIKIYTICVIVIMIIQTGLTLAVCLFSKNAAAITVCSLGLSVSAYNVGAMFAEKRARDASNKRLLRVLRECYLLRRSLEDLMTIEEGGDE